MSPGRAQYQDLRYVGEEIGRGSRITLTSGILGTPFMVLTPQEADGKAHHTSLPAEARYAMIGANISSARDAPGRGVQRRSNRRSVPSVGRGARRGGRRASTSYT